MHPQLSPVLDDLLAARTVSAASIQSAMIAIMDGNCQPAETAALLTALAIRGETPEMLAGAARAMREKASVIPTRREGLLDTCGTGGDKLHTFNISTASALVAAAAGVPVAKHGNRGVSSSSGSCDVLEALGVRVDLTPEQVGRCIDEIGIGFCFARVVHTAMKHVAPIRAELGFRTIFNLLGPLTNPARAAFQVIGTSRIATAERLAEAIRQLGTRRTLVVCGNDELDEVSLWGTTTVFDVQNDEVRTQHWTAGDLGLEQCRVDQLRVDSPPASAEIITSIFNGSAPAPQRNMVLANAGAALLAAGRVSTIGDGVRLAAETIDSGAAKGKLTELVKATRGAPK
ncbi:MAG: anthranilate phosphoribosyltransferase [Planctomycetaceae bacterium]|nr:anthranilate phosphoribosyltransferase [Planctomycetaceae bacterium]